MGISLTMYFSDGRGDFNYGIAFFRDPIPPNKGYVMQGYNATIYGTACYNASVSILLGGL